MSDIMSETTGSNNDNNKNKISGSVLLLLLAILCLGENVYCDAFQQNVGMNRISITNTYTYTYTYTRNDVPVGSSTQLNSVPLCKFSDDIHFFRRDREYRCCLDREGNFEDGFVLGILENPDLPDTTDLILGAFGADIISLSSNLTPLERAVLTPTVGLFNSYSGVIAYAEVYSGIASRTRDRISSPDIAKPKLDGTPDEKLEQAQRSSLVLVLSRPIIADQTDSKKTIQPIATIELRLQPCDAKIPFSFPWLDKLERKLANLIGLTQQQQQQQQQQQSGTKTATPQSNNKNKNKNKNNSNKKARTLQPYLSNLCVDKAYRGKYIGKALVRVVEDIAVAWGYEKIFLHVDRENEAALQLYQKEGYRDVGRRWNPFWAGKAADIAYFVKKLEKTSAYE